MDKPKRFSGKEWTSQPFLRKKIGRLAKAAEIQYNKTIIGVDFFHNAFGEN